MLIGNQLLKLAPAGFLYNQNKMDIEKYLIEKDLEQTEREIGVFFKAGIGIVNSFV